MCLLGVFTWRVYLLCVLAVLMQVEVLVIVEFGTRLLEKGCRGRVTGLLVGLLVRLLVGLLVGLLVSFTIHTLL